MKNLKRRIFKDSDSDSRSLGIRARMGEATGVNIKFGGSWIFVLTLLVLVFNPYTQEYFKNKSESAKLKIALERCNSNIAESCLYISISAKYRGNLKDAKFYKDKGCAIEPDDSYCKL